MLLSQGSYSWSMAMLELKVGLDMIAGSLVFSFSSSYMRNKSCSYKEGSQDLPRSLIQQGWQIQVPRRIKQVT